MLIISLFAASLCIITHSLLSTPAIPSTDDDFSNAGILSHPYEGSKSDSANLTWYEKPQPLLSDWPSLKYRLDVPVILDQLKLKRGIEVGVQKGILAKKSLDRWRSCEEYKLVDLWGKEDGYQEPGGHSKAIQDSWLREARGRMQRWTQKGIPEFFIMRSTDAAKEFENNYFDYIYLDARHDYCAVMEDIEHYYPKLRAGGILGGHDYIDAQYAIDRLGKTEDWSVCEDGSIHPEAVKGAVDKFAKEHNLYVITSNEAFPSWYVQKPYE